MKFFVNFLSVFRIVAAFAMIPAITFQWFWFALIVFTLAAISDWFDGFLARKYKVCSKLGGVMDHIGDKLLVVNTLFMLSIMLPIWFIVIPVVLMIARELYISGLREFLGTQKIEMPVQKARFSIAKIKTTLQMLTTIIFLALFALSTLPTPETMSRTYLIATNWMSQAGIITLWVALGLSLFSALQYTFTFARKLKQIKK